MGNEWHLIEIFFRANYGTSITVYKDEPLIFSMSILNYGNVQVRFGGPNGWTDFIKFQVLSDDAWKEVYWPLWLLEKHPSSEIAELDSSNSCYVEFGIDPEDAKRPREEFQVRSVIQLAEGVKVESNIVTVSFLKDKMPEAERETEEKLLASGRYAYKRKLYGDARKYIQRIMKTTPSSISALSLLGDLEEKEGNLALALSAYEIAVEEFHTQNPNITEPPEVILNKIDRLKALIEKEQ